MLLTVAFCAGAIACGSSLSAEEPNAARSVHLGYDAPPCREFSLEMVIDESTPGSYFMSCGFSVGYFGLQELADGRKIALFSVWDPRGDDDPKKVPEDARVQIVKHHPQGTARRFGGEGSGAQCLLPYEWKLGERYQFRVQADVGETGTTFTGAVRGPGEEEWQELAAYRRPTEGKGLQGLYSFIEDFRRDGRSPNERRAARYFHVRGVTQDGKAIELRTARFTADGTPLENVDARPLAEGFSLATGGQTTATRKIGSLLQLP